MQSKLVSKLFSLGVLAVLVLWMVVLGAQTINKIPRIQDIRLGQRTVAVLDGVKHTLTLVPGDITIWICAPHDGGKSCKEAGDVLGYILANGEEH